jgi:hypothetical protein
MLETAQTLAGAAIVMPHEGQGPLAPARAAGTVSRVPHEVQKNFTVSASGEAGEWCSRDIAHNMDSPTARPQARTFC